VTDLLASVIVAVRGDARARRLLASLASQTIPRESYEVIVVENASAGLAAGGTIVKHRPGTWAQRHAITVVDGQRSLSYLPALHLPYVAGANAGFAASALREAGGFDEELLSGNDVDACYRLGLRGDPGPTSAAVLQLIEAAGVFCGDISGAIRFRQPYLLTHPSDPA
jgi:hypothetical protein